MIIFMMLRFGQVVFQSMKLWWSFAIKSDRFATPHIQEVYPSQRNNWH